MKNDDRKEKVRKTLYLDKELADKIEAASEKDSRAFNSMAVKKLQEAFGQ